MGKLCHVRWAVQTPCHEVGLGHLGGLLRRPHGQPHCHPSIPLENRALSPASPPALLSTLGTFGMPTVQTMHHEGQQLSEDEAVVLTSASHYQNPGYRGSYSHLPRVFTELAS